MQSIGTVTLVPRRSNAVNQRSDPKPEKGKNLDFLQDYPIKCSKTVLIKLMILEWRPWQKELNTQVMILTTTKKRKIHKWQPGQTEMLCLVWTAAGGAPCSLISDLCIYDNVDDFVLRWRTTPFGLRCVLVIAIKSDTAILHYRDQND